MNYQLFHGDCLDILPTLPDKSVEAIILDLPYQTTSYKWDVVIPFAPMWEQAKRVLKNRGVFVTTASQPFTTDVINSNREWFKYCMVWEKTMASGYAHAKNMPMKYHEDILVFSSGVIAHTSLSKNRMTYNPQKIEGKPYKKFRKKSSSDWGNMQRPCITDKLFVNDGDRYPGTILRLENPNHDKHHPTQKPVTLYSYLIRTYTNPGETVLDFCMGSGTTGVSCAETGRDFIGIEKQLDYFEIAQRRIKEATAQPTLEGVA